MHLIASLHRPDARWRAGEDDVAGLQRVVLGEIRDLLRDRPDHLSEIRLLALLAVHIEPESALRRMPDLGSRDELGARRRLVEVFAEIPRTAVVFAPLLQVPPRHIEADRIAEHVIVRFLRVDAAPAFGERDDQFRLVVIVRRLGGIVDCSALTFRYRYQRELALDEEERL